MSRKGVSVLDTFYCLIWIHVLFIRNVKDVSIERNRDNVRYGPVMLSFHIGSRVVLIINAAVTIHRMIVHWVVVVVFVKRIRYNKANAHASEKAMAN